MKKLLTYTLLIAAIIVATSGNLAAKGKMQPPTFDGEIVALFNAWANEQIVHPVELQHQNGSGVVAVDFTLRASGEIDSIEILHATHPEIIDEVKRVIKESTPLWSVAQLDKVNVDYRIAATFKYPMDREASKLRTTPAPLHSDIPQSARATYPITYRADKMPQFEGESGTKAFYSWIMGHLTDRKKMKLGAFGRVILRFTVTAEGEVDDIEVMVSPDYVLTKSAISIISKSPKWTPGKQGKERVNVRLTTPVNYEIATTEE